MPLTTKALGWLAGRVGGEKARKGTMNWMNKTGLGQVLGYGGDLGLMFGAGKALQAGGKALGAGSRVGRAATSAGNFIAGTPARQYAGPGTTGAGATKGIIGRTGQQLMGSVTSPGPLRTLGRGAQAVGRAALANPEVTGAVLTSLPAMSQQAAQAEQQRQMNALLMQQTAEQQRRRQEMMDLLRPLFVRLQQGR